MPRLWRLEAVWRRGKAVEGAELLSARLLKPPQYYYLYKHVGVTLV